MKQELIKVTIGENRSIGRISASFTGTQDMSLQIQDMFVTINVEKSFVNRTKLKKENSIIDEEAYFQEVEKDTHYGFSFMDFTFHLSLWIYINYLRLNLALMI